MAAMENINERLAAALAYATVRGWRVFPLQPDNKIPFRGTHGVSEATTDPQQIERWWRRWPRANVGIAGGNGLIILDEDTYKGADAGTLLLPVTLTARSARGGLHRYFVYEGVLGNVTEGKLAPGISFRAAGYYVVAPPSTAYGGKPYTWVDAAQPVAQLPERIAQMIRGDKREERKPATPARPQSGKARESTGEYWVDKAVGRARNEGRNNAGLWLAHQLIWNECTDAEGAMRYYAGLVEDWERPFYTEGEALATLKQARLHPKREPARSQSPSPTPIRRKSAPAQTPRTDGTAALQDEPTYASGGNEPPSDDDSILLKGEADDNGNAQAMYRLFGHEFLYTPAYGWLRWTGTHWRDTPEPIVAQNAIVTLRRRRHAAVEADNESIIKATKADKTRVVGCLSLFKSYVIEPNVAAFDADPDALNCQNGVLDLKTGRLTPHDPSQRFTYCLPVAYKPKADKKLWEETVLDGLGGNREAADYFQLCVGYSLTGHTREEKMFYVYGPTRAGKGTVTETLLELMPHPLSTETDFVTFTAKRESDNQNFDLAELKPARLVVASESNREQSLNPAKIKQMTGGNLVRCAFKHKDMFTYRPQFKVWLVSNHKLNGDPDDDALWGRVQVFTFPLSRLGTEDVKRKDRLKSPENLEGVLRWAVEGAMRWYQVGRLTPPEVVMKATAEHRTAVDYIGQWIGDSCTLDAQRWAASSALMHSYQTWCEQNGVKARRANDLADSLVKRFGCKPHRQAGTGLRGYDGIALGVTPE